MGALNSFALWGSLGLFGVAVPIVIHLLYRKHRKQTDWAAMELLRRALVTRSGQVKLEDYLILALRCLALLLLALALLRPTMNSGSNLGTEKVGMVVGIDGSFSMNHGEHSRFERATEKAREIVATANAGDPLSLVLMSNRPKVLLRTAGYSPGQVQEIFENLVASTPYRLGLEKNIALLDELVDELDTPGKEAFLVTDAQEADWADLSEPARAALERLTGKASVYVVPVGTEGEENLAIERLSYTSGSLRQSGEARFAAHVRNNGRRAADGGTLEFFVDDQLSKRLTVGPLEPGESRPLEFVTLLDSAGDIRLRAQLANDALADDNVRHAVARVRSGLSVLVVEGGRAGAAQPGTDRPGSFYIKAALRPKESGVEGGVAVNQIDAPDLFLEQLRDYDVIVLSNVADIAPEMVERLATFVKRGGGLLAFLGDEVDPERYNERFGGGQVLLPAILKEPVVYEGEALGWTLAPPKSDHLLAGVVSRLPAGLLASAHVTKVMRGEPAENSEVVLELENGAPLLLARDLGSGTVLLVTTSANQSGNDLPRHPVYAILLQQAVTYLTSDPDALQRTVGEAARLPVQGREVGEFVSLVRPSGEAGDLLVTQDNDQTVAVVEFDDLGVFEIPAPGPEPGVVVAANLDPRESNVRVVDASALANQIERLGVKVLHGDTALAPAIANNRRGRELAHLLLLLAVLVFVAQSLLARHFTNKMDRDEAPDLAATLQMSRVAAARRS